MALSQKTAVVEKPRLGVTVSRRVGKAVVRNRIKRAIREWFRQSRENLGDRLDLVVIARASAGELSAREIHGILDAMVVSPVEARE